MSKVGTIQFFQGLHKVCTIFGFEDFLLFMDFVFLVFMFYCGVGASETTGAGVDARVETGVGSKWRFRYS